MAGSTKNAARFSSPLGFPVPADYKAVLALYREPDLRRSVWQLLFSVMSFALLWSLMWLSLQYSYWLTLVLAVPTAGLLVRLFIIQHDCGHRSFFKSKSANDVVGFALGVLTLTPYHYWRRTHAIHHATSGDLDRRGYGDVRMLTVKEYLKLPPLKRLVYRLHRNPFLLFGVGAFLYFVVLQRFAYKMPRSWKRERASVHWTNCLVLACVLLMWWLIGLRQFLLVHVPVAALAASVGVWLFYVQHNFDGTYWQHHDRWDYAVAGMAGSSYYQLPKVLQWFTANIGLHHIHHLDSRIPNYRLQKCFDENPAFQRVNRLTLWDSLSTVSFKLWDENEGKMVGCQSSKDSASAT